MRRNAEFGPTQAEGIPMHLVTRCGPRPRWPTSWSATTGPSSRVRTGPVRTSSRASGDRVVRQRVTVLLAEPRCGSRSAEQRRLTGIAEPVRFDAAQFPSMKTGPRADRSSGAGNRALAFGHLGLPPPLRRSPKRRFVTHRRSTVSNPTSRPRRGTQGTGSSGTEGTVSPDRPGICSPRHRFPVAAASDHLERRRVWYSHVETRGEHQCVDDPLTAVLRHPRRQPRCGRCPPSPGCTLGLLNVR